MKNHGCVAMLSIRHANYKDAFHEMTSCIEVNWIEDIIDKLKNICLFKSI
jgi:hypothetical protein